MFSQRGRISSSTLEDLGHLFLDDPLHTLRQFRIVEVLRDPAEGLRRPLRAEKVHLDPGDAVLRFDHLGHVVDRAVAHHAVQIGGVGILELADRRVPAETCNQRDAAPLQQLLDHEGVAADVVLTQHVDAELFRRLGVVAADNMFQQPIVRDMVPGRLAYPLVAFATESEDVDPELFLHLGATAWTSSPISPTGQVEKTAIDLG